MVVINCPHYSSNVPNIILTICILSTGISINSNPQPNINTENTAKKSNIKGVFLANQLDLLDS